MIERACRKPKPFAVWAMFVNDGNGALDQMFPQSLANTIRNQAEISEIGIGWIREIEFKQADNAPRAGFAQIVKIGIRAGDNLGNFFAGMKEACLP